jgi:hypothetical protein
VFYIIIRMKFRTIIDILKRSSLSQVKTPLGRWNNHNYRETALKIKYANEDNCGISCSNYKNITQIQQNDELNDDNEYIYMMGYESVHESVH